MSNLERLFGQYFEAHPEAKLIVEALRVSVEKLESENSLLASTLKELRDTMALVMNQAMRMGDVPTADLMRDLIELSEKTPHHSATTEGSGDGY